MLRIALIGLLAFAGTGAKGGEGYTVRPEGTTN